MKTKLAILLTLVIAIITATFFSLSAMAQTPPYQFPQYGPVTVLMEDTGSGIAELSPADLGGTSNDPNFTHHFMNFYILKEGDTYFLWLSTYEGVPTQYINSIEQHFESQDGLIWHNRMDTNLAQSNQYRHLRGIRQIITDSSTYEGWEQYYYERSDGWGHALRYITSTNGITWTVVNQPALIGAQCSSVIKEGSTYHMWVNPSADSHSNFDSSLRYRVSNDPGSNWGHWQTGGTLVNLDNGGEIQTVYSRVRQLPDGTYQLFYFTDGYTHLNMATSSNGIDFTTAVSNIVDLTVTLPSVSLQDFAVVDVNGEDWFYFTYTDQDNNGHIAVSRPIYPDLSLQKTVAPSVVLPGEWLTYTLTFSNIGNSIATDVTITDIVPSLLTNLTVNSNIPMTDTGHTPAYVWQLPNLPPATGGTITLTGQVDPAWTGHINVTNVATITATSLETNTNNNQAQVNATINQTLTSTYLPLILKSYPPATFPVHIGNTIARRPVTHQGETFYNITRQVPDLPAGGRFYLSSQPNSLAPVLVDDEIVLLLNGTPVFAYDFSSHGSPQAATLAVPRPTMEQIAGRTITVEYRDIYGAVVQASPVWLIWLP